MSDILFVVNNPDRWTLEVPEVKVISARDYLTDPTISNLRRARVFNLCRSYRYQANGYYVSLLAEARGHRPLPNVTTIQDLKSKSIVRVVSQELNDLIEKSLAHLQSDHFILSIYFSRNVARHYDRLSRHLFNLFPSPLLRAYFTKTEDGWNLRSISPIPTSEIPIEHGPTVVSLAKEYFSRRVGIRPTKAPPRYHLAILVDEKEGLTAPSDSEALEKFEKAAETLAIATQRISKDDYGRIPEFDALFIRMTTAVNSPTYRFARKAQAEGLVVIDDPQSIVRCTNKVYLAEIFERYKIPVPKTLIVYRDNIGEAMFHIGFPCILKEPDSSFSQGVIKVESEEEFVDKTNKILERSELVIAQQFIPTEYDWRVGIIDQKPFYAAKYFMAAGHWQIYNHAQEGSKVWGRAQAVPLELVPQRVVNTALKAANLVGNGLYGVDLKYVDRKVYVIEVNDNPSIESGVEDELLHDNLYNRVMEVFLKRLQIVREGRNLL